MTTVGSLWAFGLVVGLLTLTPVLDTALIVRTAAVGRAHRAWGVVAGIQTGTLLWGVLTSLGITALLTASVLAYEVLRWVGVAYLVWTGARMVWATRRSSEDAVVAAAPAGAAPSRGPRTVTGGGAFRAGWRRGLATNLLNPKMEAFYVALLPQFIPAGASPLTFGVLLAGVHVALGVVWSTVLVLAARRLRGVLSRPRAQRVLDRVTGAVIAGFGVRLATGTP